MAGDHKQRRRCAQIVFFWERNLNYDCIKLELVKMNASRFNDIPLPPADKVNNKKTLKCLVRSHESCANLIKMSCDKPTDSACRFLSFILMDHTYSCSSKKIHCKSSNKYPGTEPCHMLFFPLFFCLNSTQQQWQKTTLLGFVCGYNTRAVNHEWGVLFFFSCFCHVSLWAGWVWWIGLQCRGQMSETTWGESKVP